MSITAWSVLLLVQGGLPVGEDIGRRGGGHVPEAEVQNFDCAIVFELEVVGLRSRWVMNPS